MKIKEIFNLAIKMGVDADFRPREMIEKLLTRKKEKYQKLLFKKEIDPEILSNPYPDTQIHNIAQDKEIKKVLVGIDIEVSEIILGKILGDIDLVIAHHPIGKGLAYLNEVMEMQIQIYHLYGVPINIAQRLIKEKISEVARGINRLNHFRAVDAARLLGVNLINIHTPSDNLAGAFLEKLIKKKNPERIEDLLSLIEEIPEYREAKRKGIGPKIFVGDKENYCGKIALTEITGGTEGSPKLYEKMAIAGIGTVVSMHQSEEHRKEAEKANINVIVAGHIPSDSLGMNLFLDELEKRGIEIVPCSGLIRVSRTKK